MKRVHDKLNILIVCTVVAIAAVGYLLIQTGSIDPSMGSGSGITSIKKAQKYSEKNTIAVELEGEEIQEVLQNEDFMKMIASPEFAKLVESDEFLKVLDDPVFSIVADVMGGGPGKSGTIAKITNFDAVKAEKEKNPTGGIPLELEMMNGLDPKGVVGINMLMIRKGRVSAVVERLRKEYENQLKDQQFKLKSLDGVTE